MDHQPLVPLQLLATEWDAPIEELANQLADNLITDNLGIRHVRRADAAQLLAQRQAQAHADAQADAAYREHLDTMLAPTLARVAAIQRAQRAARADGQIDSNTPALAAMRMNDPDGRLEQKGRLFDELLNAGNRGEYGTMHRFTPQEAQP
jgi:hypothetical protein